MICKYCGKEFEPAYANQLYCSTSCRIKMGNQKKSEAYYEKKALMMKNKNLPEITISKKCHRDDCIHYSQLFSNRCNCLQDIDNVFCKTCSFYKNK